MSSLAEILDLVARWIHVIAGIMWVGNSLLFNWLDRSLEPASASRITKKPVGKIWLLHSGGFYYVEKTLLDGEKLPSPLHWFKWQAYTTMISGAVLLVVVYYATGRATLEDPSVANLSHGKAVAIGVSAIVLGGMIYDMMQRAAASAPALATGVWVVALTTISIALTQLLSGRAAFLHVGAMLGTIMAANVAHTIVPSQRELVKSVEEGGSSRLEELSARAKRVSIHNNYFTFPVIALMVSNHFSSIYSSRYNWLLLLIMVAGGAATRHVLNIRWTYTQWKPALAGTIASTVIAMWIVIILGAPRAAAAEALAGPVAFEDVRHIIDRRCSVCHSARPTDVSLGVAPGGVMFDTRAQIEAKADRIRERAYVTRTMPPANKTGITEAERAALGAWSTSLR